MQSIWTFSYFGIFYYCFLSSTIDANESFLARYHASKLDARARLYEDLKTCGFLEIGSQICKIEAYKIYMSRIFGTSDDLFHEDLQKHVKQQKEDEEALATRQLISSIESSEEEHKNKTDVAMPPHLQFNAHNNGCGPDTSTTQPNIRKNTLAQHHKGGKKEGNSKENKEEEEEEEEEEGEKEEAPVENARRSLIDLPSENKKRARKSLLSAGKADKSTHQNKRRSLQAEVKKLDESLKRRLKLNSSPEEASDERKSAIKPKAASKPASKDTKSKTATTTTTTAPQPSASTTTEAKLNRRSLIDISAEGNYYMDDDESNMSDTYLTNDDDQSGDSGRRELEQRRDQTSGEVVAPRDDDTLTFVVNMERTAPFKFNTTLLFDKDKRGKLLETIFRDFNKRY